MTNLLDEMLRRYFAARPGTNFTAAARAYFRCDAVHSADGRVWIITAGVRRDLDAADAERFARHIEENDDVL